MYVLADAFQFDVPDPEPGVPSLSDIWVMALADIAPSVLNEAFRKLLETWKPDYGRRFPAPGDLRALLVEAQTLARQAESDTTWQAVLLTIRERWHPDLGWRGPVLEHKLGLAVLAAGGVDHLWNASSEQLVWAKKEFMDFYRRDAELEEHRALLPVPPTPALKETV
jgi:hypothetical protein